MDPSYGKKTYSQKQKAGQILSALTKTDMFRKVCVYSVHQQKCCLTEFWGFRSNLVAFPAPRKGKKRDPGNEVGLGLSYYFSVFAFLCQSWERKNELLRT